MCVCVHLYLHGWQPRGILNSLATNNIYIRVFIQAKIALYISLSLYIYIYM